MKEKLNTNTGVMNIRIRPILRAVIWRIASTGASRFCNRSGAITQPDKTIVGKKIINGGTSMRYIAIQKVRIIPYAAAIKPNQTSPVTIRLG